MKISFPKILLIAALTVTGLARAEWPEKPIRVIVPHSAGAGGDVLIRLVQDDLAKRLGQPIIVENREGAGGNIGAQVAAGAAPDGYTLLIASTGQFVINQHLYQSYTIDPLKAFAPIIHIADIPGMLFASATMPAKDLRDLAAQSKDLKGKLNYGTPGLGTTPQMALEMLNRSLGLGMTHVAYRGSPQVLQGLLGGEIQLGYGVPGAALPFVQQGKLRVVAVTGEKRMPSIPDTPTFKELGLDHIGGVTWWALVAPAGTPEPILDRINSAMRQAFAVPDVRKRLEELGIIPVAGTRKEMNDLMGKEAIRWSRTIKELGLEKQN